MFTNFKSQVCAKSSGFLYALIALLLVNNTANAQGTWTKMQDASIDSSAGVMLLLTDGTVIVKTGVGSSDNYGSGWNKITPDIHGSYINGIWSRIQPMNDSRLYFSSQVLKDGRVYVAGGEYGTGRNRGEIYDPIADQWNPAGPLTDLNDTISDGNSEILDDGRVLQSVVLSGHTVSHKTYLFDPVANTYSPGSPTLGIDNESAWLKLPDNSLLYVDIYSNNSERFIPDSNKWVRDSTVPVALYDPYGYETGPAFLLPNGKAFFLGASGNTAYYTPSGNTHPGVWTTGPKIPDTLGAPDAAGAMMVNGKILCALSPIPKAGNVFQKPMYFYEFDYRTNLFTKILAPGDKDSIGRAAFFSNMLCLPDGNILFGCQGNGQYYIYSPDGTPLATGKPIVDNIIKINCDTFIATGRLFNGITEGACYGDDWQMSTNFPIVRISRNDTVYYAKTYGWNTYGVMRGAKLDTTSFSLPDGLPLGTYSLQVVANGNASAPVSFEVCSYLGTAPVKGISEGMALYPNPAFENTSVEFVSNNSGNVSIRVQDVLGRVVSESFENAVQGKNIFNFNLHGLGTGVYNVNLVSGKKVYNSRLIIR